MAVVVVVEEEEVLPLSLSLCGRSRGSSPSLSLPADGGSRTEQITKHTSPSLPLSLSLPSPINESTAVAKSYFFQLISALASCHDKGICHRDVKPNNLLLDNSYSQLKVSEMEEKKKKKKRKKKKKEEEEEEEAAARMAHPMGSVISGAWGDGEGAARKMGEGLTHWLDEAAGG